MKIHYSVRVGWVYGAPWHVTWFFSGTGGAIPMRLSNKQRLARRLLKGQGAVTSHQTPMTWQEREHGVVEAEEWVWEAIRAIDRIGRIPSEDMRRLGTAAEILQYIRIRKLVDRTDSI